MKVIIMLYHTTFMIQSENCPAKVCIKNKQSSSFLIFPNKQKISWNQNECHNTETMNKFKILLLPLKKYFIILITFR